MPPDQIDPQILSKVLRTKLGLSWDPQWDTSKQVPEAATADDSKWLPPGTPAPMPQANMGTMQGARDLANGLVRRQLGLPPRYM